MSLFWSIFFTTFLVEDWAIAASLALVAQNKMSWGTAFLACFAGISVGDIILYIFGRLIRKIPRLQKSSYFQKAHIFLQETNSQNKIAWAVAISRAIPGTRLITYVGSGVAGFPAWKFLVLTPITVAIWVAVAFSGGRALQSVFARNWILGLILLIILLSMLKHYLPLFIDPWKRKTLRYSWKQWGIFEFWPAWLAYSPLVPYYAYLSLKNFSLTHPFYANPAILNSGLIGESKWEILKFLNQNHPATLKMTYISKGTSFEDTKKLISEAGLAYPFFAKPIVGQRGFAVRAIKDETGLADYLQKSNFDFLAQEKSRYIKEAGLFYIRFPNSEKGDIYSITDKEFPFVVGDGKTKLGDLILKDKRAQIIARQYFERHKAMLNEIIKPQETFFLAECGNHCQGAIFKNGESLNTELLRQKVEEVTKQIPNFYFGRVDVRYKDHESLMQGEDFQVIEINGAGADMTHIYDPKTSISEAYGVMFKQYRLLFKVGKQSKALHGKNANVKLMAFIKECLRVQFRSNQLAVSS